MGKTWETYYRWRFIKVYSWENHINERFSTRLKWEIEHQQCSLNGWCKMMPKRIVTSWVPAGWRMLTCCVHKSLRRTCVQLVSHIAWSQTGNRVWMASTQHISTHRALQSSLSQVFWLCNFGDFGQSAAQFRDDRPPALCATSKLDHSEGRRHLYRRWQRSRQSAALTLGPVTWSELFPQFGKTARIALEKDLGNLHDIYGGVIIHVFSIIFIAIAEFHHF